MLKVAPRIRTSYYEVHASNAEELYREIYLNHGPVGNGGERFAARTRWDIQWRFKHEQQGNMCFMTDVTVAIGIVNTFPRWIDIGRASPEYAVRWQSFLGALTTFQALHQMNGNMAADEIEAKLRPMPPSSDCVTLEANANQIAQQVIAKFQERDIELNRSTRYGETLGATFPH